MTAAESEMWICATHEAGHAVSATIAGMFVKALVLHRPGTHPTEGGRCELYDHLEELEADPLRFAVYVFSGAAAEANATGHTSSRDGADREFVKDLAVVALNVEPTSPRVMTWITAAETLAHAQMRDERVKKWVQAVAKQLLRTRRMTNREIQECRPGWPR
jgi:hypothetical protein